MRLPVRLNGVLLRAPLALPLFLTVLSGVVLFDTGEIAECPSRIVMDTRRLRTDVNSFTNLITRPLSELPRQVVAASVKLQVLISLESFVADLAHESVRS